MVISIIFLLGKQTKSRREVDNCAFGATSSQIIALSSNTEVSILTSLAGHIHSITPTYGSTKTEITITGTNLLSKSTCIHVTLGEYTCQIIGEIQESNGIQTIKCNINSMPNDLKPMLVNKVYPINIAQGGTGYCFIDLVEESHRGFLLKASIFGISPKSGSVGGGTLITINGEGFIQNETKVIVDGYICDIKEVDYAFIICMTRSRPGSSDGKVEVIGCGDI